MPTIAEIAHEAAEDIVGAIFPDYPRGHDQLKGYVKNATTRIIQALEALVPASYYPGLTHQVEDMERRMGMPKKKGV